MTVLKKRRIQYEIDLIDQNRIGCKIKRIAFVILKEAKTQTNMEKIFYQFPYQSARKY